MWQVLLFLMRANVGYILKSFIIALTILKELINFNRSKNFKPQISKVYTVKGYLFLPIFSLDHNADFFGERKRLG